MSAEIRTLVSQMTRSVSLGYRDLIYERLGVLGADAALLGAGSPVALGFPQPLELNLTTKCVPDQLALGLALRASDRLGIAHEFIGDRNREQLRHVYEDITYRASATG